MNTIKNFIDHLSNNYINCKKEAVRIGRSQFGLKAAEARGAFNIYAGV